MRFIGLIGALAFAAPLAAQSNKLRTDDVIAVTRARTQAAETAAAASQTQGRRSAHVPPGQLPPAGMCRIWVDGVPPGQQPAPTDCQTAVATKPANASILWGTQSAFPGKGKGRLNKSDDDEDGGGRGVGKGGDENDDGGSLPSRSIAKSANQGLRTPHGRHKGDD